MEAILHTLAASIQPVKSLTAVNDGGWCSRTGFVFSIQCTTNTLLLALIEFHLVTWG